MSKLTIGLARMSYAHVFTPFKFAGEDEGKYSVTLIIPKTDKAMVDKIKAAIKLAAEESKSKWAGKVPAKLAQPLRDGDTDNDKDLEELKGCWYIRAKSNKAPGVVDKARQPITKESEFYSGCYGYAGVSFIGYSNAGNNGIGCYLNNVMKYKDGEPLSGGSTPDEDFAAIEDDEDIF
jgi:hypothetical protein